MLADLSSALLVKNPDNKLYTGCLWLKDLFAGLPNPQYRRVINRLRHVYPDVTWTYVPGAYMWDASDGSYVVKVAAFGDEEGAMPSHLCRYWPGNKRSEWVPWAPTRRNNETL